MSTQIDMGPTPNGMMMTDGTIPLSQSQSAPVDAASSGVGHEAGGGVHSGGGNNNNSSSATAGGGGGGGGLFNGVLLEALRTTLSSSGLTRGAQAEQARAQAWAVWRSAKPWKEFGNTKKMNVPTNGRELQQRLSDNLTYFASNYALCFVVLSVAGVLVHPMAFLCILALGALYVWLFVQRATSVGPIHIPANGNGRMGAFVLVAFILLYVTDAIGIIGSWAVFAAVVSVIHAACRVSAKEPDFESPVGAV